VSYYTKLLSQRVQHALSLVRVEGENWAPELATVLREIADEIQSGAHRDGTATSPAGGLGQGVREALGHILSLERNGWAAELVAILRELADEMAPSSGPDRAIRS
jgi:hypothetical protein